VSRTAVTSAKFADVDSDEVLWSANIKYSNDPRTLLWCTPARMGMFSVFNLDEEMSIL
jgi:hypothetical protein